MGVGMGTERWRGGERVGVVRLRGTISRQEHCYGDEDEKAGEGWWLKGGDISLLRAVRERVTDCDCINAILRPLEASFTGRLQLRWHTLSGHIMYKRAYIFYRGLCAAQLLTYAQSQPSILEGPSRHWATATRAGRSVSSLDSIL